MTGTVKQKSLHNLRYSYFLAKDFSQTATVPCLGFAYFALAASGKLAL
jgi:hypothetical protein